MQITPTPSISKNDLHQISTPSVLAHNRIFPVIEELAGLFRDGGIPVSYTHLTLPTILRV